MTNLTGKQAIFNYDRLYMSTEQIRHHDGATVTINDEPYNDGQGHTIVSITIHSKIWGNDCIKTSAMLQELTVL